MGTSGSNIAILIVAFCFYHKIHLLVVWGLCILTANEPGLFCQVNIWKKVSRAVPGMSPSEKPGLLVCVWDCLNAAVCSCSGLRFDPS